MTSVDCIALFSLTFPVKGIEILSQKERSKYLSTLITSMLAANFDKIGTKEDWDLEIDKKPKKTDHEDAECQDNLKKRLELVEKKNKIQSTQIKKYLAQEKVNSAAWKKLQQTLEGKIASLEHQLAKERTISKDISSPERQIVKRIAEFVATHNKTFDSIQRQWNKKLQSLQNRLKDVDSKVEKCSMKVQTEKDVLSLSKMSKKCAREMVDDLGKRMDSTEDVRMGKRDIERKRMKELQEMMMFYSDGYDKLTIQWQKEKEDLKNTVANLQTQLQKRNTDSVRPK